MAGEPGDTAWLGRRPGHRETGDRPGYKETWQAQQGSTVSRH